jgi:hypothetical protein
VLILINPSPSNVKSLPFTFINSPLYLVANL